MKHILFVSENLSKYKEIENYLKKSNANVSIQMIKPELEIQEIQSLDRNQVIIRKLHDAYTSIKPLLNHHTIISNSDSTSETWLMVEDTSLTIEKMGGFPGTFIKYYLQSLPITTISHNNWGSNSTAYVTLGICRCTDNSADNSADTKLLSSKVFEGLIDGLIVEPQGKNGFGYDPIFRPKGSQVTNAEMSIDEKEKYNPRTIAFQKVLDFLE
jgi:non-canonical purine NTP pyrophosphatase (RdgB/HAM1 family)